MLDDGVDEVHRLRSEVASPVLPFVVLLGEDHADQTDDAGSVGEDANDRSAELDLTCMLDIRK